MESKTEYHWYLPVIFHPSSFELDISYLFRGDGRSPQEIFASGFHARGRDFDLLSHFRPSPGLSSSPDSAYVSTSRSKQVAATFPKNVKNNGFLYLIKPQEQGIDLEKTFGKLEQKVPNA